MKLLAKSEVTKAKSLDRQREVDEGMKLAKRVDTLREVALQEERSLTRYRTETVGKIQKEVTELGDKRDALLEEVRFLAARREELSAPLNEEWDVIYLQKELLSKRETGLDGREAGIRLREADLADRQDAVTKHEQTVVYAHDDARERLQKAGILKDDSERLNRDAQSILTRATTQSKSLMATAEERLAWVEAREKAAFAKEEELRNQEIELAKDFSRLMDREATLARNLKRNGTSK